MADTAVQEKPADKKAEKRLQTIDFRAALLASPAAELFEGANFAKDGRSASTADVAAEVGVVKSEDVPFNQEALIFKALTPNGVTMLCKVDDLQSKDETPEQMHVGLFNYALGLRIRGNVSRTMKQAAAGPEKVQANASKSLAALLAQTGQTLTDEQRAVLKALGVNIA